jgi:hypothetical protein
MKSTKLSCVLPLITVWLQVRILPGLPMKSVYEALFRSSGITARETRRFVYACHALASSQTNLALRTRLGPPLFNRSFGGLIVRYGWTGSHPRLADRSIDSNWNFGRVRFAPGAAVAGKRMHMRAVFKQ